MTSNNPQTEPFHFIQLADPQFGMYAALSGKTAEEIAQYRARGLNVVPSPKIEGFDTESRLFREAVTEANRLRPDFVVTCGDIVQNLGQDRAVGRGAQDCSRAGRRNPHALGPGQPRPGGLFRGARAQFR